MNITQQLQKWGNGTGVRLPKKVLEAARIKPGQTLSVDLRGRSIILTPVASPKRPTLDLDQLLADITSENTHEQIDWGEPVGKEVW